MDSHLGELNKVKHINLIGKITDLLFYWVNFVSPTILLFHLIKVMYSLNDKQKNLNKCQTGDLVSFTQKDISSRVGVNCFATWFC